MDSSIGKHESMNPHDLSFTWLHSESSLSDPKCPVPAETASLMQQGHLDSAVLDEHPAHTELHQNSSTKNSDDFNFPQIDSKFTISYSTDSVLKEDQMDHAVYGELTAPTEDHQNSFTEKHESLNPPDLIAIQTNSKSNSSDPTCSVPIETSSFTEQGQREVVQTEFHQLCFPRKPTKVPSVSFLFVSNTYKVGDLLFQKPKSRDDQTPLPPIYSEKETPFYIPQSRDETSGDRIPLPPISWQKENSLCRMTILGPVCAALFAAYWGWICLNASELI